MTKIEFLSALREALIGLPQADIDERVTFYGEMIDDRLEDGLSEEDAVADIGTVEAVVAEIVAGTPLSKLVKEKIKPKRRIKTWEIVLLAVGSPVWGALLISALAVVFSLYVTLWCVVLSLWSVFVSFAGSALGCMVGGALVVVFGNALIGVALLGAGMVCAALAIFSFFGCKAATKGVCKLTKHIMLGIKNKLVGKGEAQ